MPDLDDAALHLASERERRERFLAQFIEHDWPRACATARQRIQARDARLRRLCTLVFPAEEGSDQAWVRQLVALGEARAEAERHRARVRRLLWRWLAVACVLWLVWRAVG